MNYLHKVDLFKDWNDKELRIIFFNSIEVNYRYQEVVYKYGSNSDFIYIIKKGRFEVIKAISTYDRATLRVAHSTHSDATLTGFPPNSMWRQPEGNSKGCACVICEVTHRVAPPGRGYININILGLQSIWIWEQKYWIFIRLLKKIYKKIIIETNCFVNNRRKPKFRWKRGSQWYFYGVNYSLCESNRCCIEGF